MIYTINARTKAVSFDRHNPEHTPMARNQFGDATPGYLRAWIKPNYPVPATNKDAGIAMNHLLIIRCDCGMCIQNYMDALEYDFPDAF